VANDRLLLMGISKKSKIEKNKKETKEKLKG
jgi:hypothetical protein